MNFYLNINTLEVTDFDLNTIKYDTFAAAIDSTLKGGNNKVYVYNLDKLHNAFMKYFNSNNYSFVPVENGTRDKLDKKECQISSFFGSDAIYFIKARRNSYCQIIIQDIRKMFGKATEEAIAASVGEKDLNLGMPAALDNYLSLGNTSATLAGNAFKDLKLRSFGKDHFFKFRETFPLLNNEIARMADDASQGGLCYMNDTYKGKTVVNGVTYDVNSMYPSIMAQEWLPHGEPLAFEGKFEFKTDSKFGCFALQKLFIKKLSLKPEGIPCIKIRDAVVKVNTGLYTNACDVELTLTTIDLELLLDNYNVEGIEYLGGYAFKARKNMFKSFIDYWMNEKIEGKKVEDDFRVLIAKNMLNNAYGKFGLQVGKARAKYVKSRRGVLVKTIDSSNITDYSSAVYTPMSAFITAYARKRMVAAIKANKDRFVYCDTDSITLVGTEKAQEIRVHDTRLGAWKLETVWTRAKFLGKKQYIMEKSDGEFKVACAGMPKEFIGQVNSFESFEFGSIFDTVCTFYDELGVSYDKLGSYELKDKNIA